MIRRVICHRRWTRSLSALGTNKEEAAKQHGLRVSRRPGIAVLREEAAKVVNKGVNDPRARPLGSGLSCATLIPFQSVRSARNAYAEDPAQTNQAALLGSCRETDSAGTKTPTCARRRPAPRQPGWTLLAGRYQTSACRPRGWRFAGRGRRCTPVWPDSPRPSNVRLWEADARSRVPVCPAAWSKKAPRRRA